MEQTDFFKQQSITPIFLYRMVPNSFSEAARPWKSNFLTLTSCAIFDAVRYSMYQSGWNFKIKLVNHFPKFLKNVQLKQLRLKEIMAPSALTYQTLRFPANLLYWLCMLCRGDCGLFDHVLHHFGLSTNTSQESPGFRFHSSIHKS